MITRIEDTQTSDRPLLEQMIEVIVDTAHPQQIILFGSRAKGTAHESSDYDFLIVDDMPFDKNRSRRRQISKISRALASFRIPTDVLLYSKEEVNCWQHSLNNVIGRALREGTVVYERH